MFMDYKKFNIGDLVEIVYIGEGTAYFPWTEVPVPGIYLGQMEFIHYVNPNEKKTDICYKVWALGKVRYIADISEIKLLSPKTTTPTALSGAAN